MLGADIFSSFLVPALWTRLSAEAPGVKLRFLDSARGDVERLLRDDLIDLALERPLDLPDWASRRLLFRSPFVVIAARGNKILSKARVEPGAKIPLALFTSLHHAIRSIDGGLAGIVDEALARAGAARTVVLAVPHFHGLAATVAASDLVAAVPVEFARMVAKDLKLAIYEVPIDVAAPAIQMYWHRRHDRAPAHRWLRDLIVAASDF